MIELCKQLYKEQKPNRSGFPYFEIMDDSDDEGENTTNWKIDDGVSPVCLQYICKRYNLSYISHYAYI